MANYWSKKECDTVINMYKDKTAYFGNEGEPMTYDAMFNMLRYRMGFGFAETMVIIASLIKCGAIFTKKTENKIH